MDKVWFIEYGIEKANCGGGDLLLMASTKDITCPTIYFTHLVAKVAHCPSSAF